MSKKHNAPHPERGRSRYSERLAARGLKRAPALAEIEGTQGLRTRQERRKELTGSPFPVAARTPEERLLHEIFEKGTAA